MICLSGRKDSVMQEIPSVSVLKTISEETGEGSTTNAGFDHFKLGAANTLPEETVLHVSAP